MRLHAPSLDSHTSWEYALECATNARTRSTKYRVFQVPTPPEWHTWADVTTPRWRLELVPA